MVRYLYIIFDRIQITMQEVKTAIMQDMQILTNNNNAQNFVRSSAVAVECYVCGKGLKDGHSITAKTLPNGTSPLFCDVHYPLQ